MEERGFEEGGEERSETNVEAIRVSMLRGEGEGLELRQRVEQYFWGVEVEGVVVVEREVDWLWAFRGPVGNLGD